MFCSNCGKSLRPEENECRHCHANLGEDRFYGNTYTSSQVRIPAEALNQAPIGGMLTYTRTSYMSYDNQPENDDLYSNTTYRPLLGENEVVKYPETESLEPEEAIHSEAEAAATADASSEEAPAAEESIEKEAPAVQEEAAEFEELVVEESEIIEENAAEAFTDAQASDTEYADTEYADADYADTEYVQPEAEDIPAQPKTYNWNPDGSIDPEDVPDLEKLPKATISPRVLSYMEELERMEQKRAAGSGASLRMPAFLQKLRKKSELTQEELPEAEDLPGAEIEYEAPENDAYEESSGAAEAESVDTDDTEYAEDTESADDAAYAEEAEYIAEDDDFATYEDEDYAEEEGTPSGFRLNIDFKALLQNRILKISAAAVLVVAILAAGIYWLSFVATKRAKIADVNYDAYTKGIELLTANLSEEYRSEMQDICLTNTSYAASAFSEDMTELSDLMPAEPAENDELFITTLTIIQDAIAEAIKADADAVLSGTEAEQSAASELRWQAIANAVDKLSNASTPGELSVLVADLESVVAPTPTPTPEPTPVQYETLTNGLMNNLDVQKMQNRLINLGFLTGTADGDFGNGTESAVKAFQRAAGLTADGVATPEMQEALYSENAPRNSATVDTTAAPGDPAAQ